MAKSIDDYIRCIPDFPKEGVMFRDVTTVLQDAEGFKMAVDSMADLVEELGCDVIAGAEARGFIFGAAIAYKLGKPFVTVRKKGKLPYETIGEKYDLEYGQAEIEIHIDAIKPGQRVVLVDDLIATGGTIAASAKLIERLGGKVAGCVFLVELAGLNGRKALSKYEVRSVISYEGK